MTRPASWGPRNAANCRFCQRSDVKHHSSGLCRTCFRWRADARRMGAAEAVIEKHGLLRADADVRHRQQLRHRPKRRQHRKEFFVDDALNGDLAFLAAVLSAQRGKQRTRVSEAQVIRYLIKVAADQMRDLPEHRRKL